MMAQFLLSKYDETFVKIMALDGLDFMPDRARGQEYEGELMFAVGGDAEK